MTTLLISHPACLQHLTPMGHPERPDRLRAVEQALAADKFKPLIREQAPMASLESIALCHPMEYVEEIREASPKEGLIHLDADTSMSPGSFEAALRPPAARPLRSIRSLQRRPKTLSWQRAHPAITPRRRGQWDFVFLTTSPSPRGMPKSSMASAAPRSSTLTCITAMDRRRFSGRSEER